MALMLAAYVTMWAQDVQRLVVWQKTGEKVYIDLAEQPETTFAGGNLVINTQTNTISYPLKNVLRYTYEGKATAISAPKLQPNEVAFKQNGDMMVFDGLSDGAQIIVYSADGQQLSVQTAHGGQPSIVSFVGLPAGIYIVKTGDATYKFLKR